MPKTVKLTKESKAEKIKNKTALFCRTLLEEDMKTGRYSGRHLCQMHALLSNHVLNETGIKSKVVGLDFQWLMPTWRGLHYVSKTEDGDYVDALPESNRLINADMGEGQVLVLSPSNAKYGVYAEAERRASLRNWGFISPERLAENEDQFPKVLQLYENRINAFIRENKR